VSKPSTLAAGCLAHWAGVAMGRLLCIVPAGRMHCVQLGCGEIGPIAIPIFQFFQLRFKYVAKFKNL
jgi:hypothetical protein